MTVWLPCTAAAGRWHAVPTEGTRWEARRLERRWTGTGQHLLPGSKTPSTSFAGIVYRPDADHRIVWRRDNTNPAVTALIDIVRELRATAAFLPPEVPHAPDMPHRGTTTGGTKPD
ncbi:hypothetical protein ACGFY3_49105 [Streptomyces mirabilis]|uniref:hypothetical protein n=1 Tax=Streptomyces mirabilis TaxID=68239 RepID=UPI00372247D0